MGKGGGSAGLDDYIYDDAGGCCTEACVSCVQLGAAQKRVWRVWLQGMVALPRAAGTLPGTGDSRQGCARRLPQTAPARPG